jgi:hypothetical protein
MLLRVMEDQASSDQSIAFALLFNSLRLPRHVSGKSFRPGPEVDSHRCVDDIPGYDACVLGGDAFFGRSLVKHFAEQLGGALGPHLDQPLGTAIRVVALLQIAAALCRGDDLGIGAQRAEASVRLFAIVLDQLVAIRLAGPAVGERVLLNLASRRRAASGLRRLELIETRVSAVRLAQLHGFESLRHLDLSGTRVSRRAVQSLLAHLDRLESIVLKNTGLGWWSRLHLRLSHHRLTVS